MMQRSLHDDNKRVLGHEPNLAVLKLLRLNAVRLPDGSYEERTHPDLADCLAKSAAGLDAKLKYFYAIPTLVSSNGVIFAYVRGANVVVFRAPVDGFSRELPAPRRTSEVLPGWVATVPFPGSRSDWNARAGDAAIRDRFVEAANAARALRPPRSEGE